MGLGYSHSGSAATEADLDTIDNATGVIHFGLDNVSFIFFLCYTVQ